MIQDRFAGHILIPTGETTLYETFDYLIDFKKRRFSTFSKGDETRHETFESLKAYTHKFLTDDIEDKLCHLVYVYEYDLFESSKLESKAEIEKFLLVLDKIKPR